MHPTHSRKRRQQRLTENPQLKVVAAFLRTDRKRGAVALGLRIKTAGVDDGLPSVSFLMHPVGAGVPRAESFSSMSYLFSPLFVFVLISVRIVHVCADFLTAPQASVYSLLTTRWSLLRLRLRRV